MAYSGLPANLQEMARVRLERPEATLKELGEALDPPVGKIRGESPPEKLSLFWHRSCGQGSDSH